MIKLNFVIELINGIESSTYKNIAIYTGITNIVHSYVTFSSKDLYYHAFDRYSINISDIEKSMIKKSNKFVYQCIQIGYKAIFQNIFDFTDQICIAYFDKQTMSVFTLGEYYQIDIQKTDQNVSDEVNGYRLDIKPIKKTKSKNGHSKSKKDGDKKDNE